MEMEIERSERYTCGWDGEARDLQTTVVAGAVVNEKVRAM